MNIKNYGYYTPMYSPKQLPALIKEHGFGNRVFITLGSDRPAFIGLVDVNPKMTWLECSQKLSRGCYFEPCRMTDSEVESLRSGATPEEPTNVVTTTTVVVKEKEPVIASLLLLPNGDKVVVDDDGKPFLTHDGKPLVLTREVVEVDDEQKEGPKRPLTEIEEEPPKVRPREVVEEEEPPPRRPRVEEEEPSVKFGEITPEWEFAMKKWLLERNYIRLRRREGPFPEYVARKQTQEYELMNIIRRKRNPDGTESRQYYYVDAHPKWKGDYAPFVEGVDFQNARRPKPRLEDFQDPSE